MRAKLRLAALMFTAMLSLSGCFTHQLHSEMNTAFPKHKSVETTETLNYMGLNGKKELVLITDKHHFVLSPAPKPFATIRNRFSPYSANGRRNIPKRFCTFTVDHLV